MSRIAETFAALKRNGRPGFIPFITAGDPDLGTTGNLIIELAQAGATLIELGVPFTDPMADGPVIQRASERALRHHFGLTEILEVVAAARKQTSVPIILFSYFNPLLQFCMERTAAGTSALPAVKFEILANAAKQAGVDGILVTDLVPEEAGEFAAAWRANDLDMIFLVAPTSTVERLQTVAKLASGFIYAVSRAGVTGAREELSAEAEKLVRRVRQFSGLPVAVGFGISKRDHVRDVSRYADAVVVGSAIVSEIEQAQASGEVVSRVGDFVRKLSGTDSR
jgi:tryptophan synthase alpha chain